MGKYLRIIYVVAICLAIGYLSSLVTQSSIDTWYPTIEKPFFNPPNWVFAPVWTLLFIMMGVAGGLVWNKLESNEKEVKKSVILFYRTIAIKCTMVVFVFWSQQYTTRFN